MKQSDNLTKPKRYVANAIKQNSPKGLLLYFLPAALIPATIIALSRGLFIAIIVNAVGFALYLLSTKLLRQGLKAERDYKDKSTIHPSKYPLKFIAAMITALTTGMIARFGVGNEIAVSLLFVVGAFLGMFLCFGFDPRENIKIASAGGYSGEEIMQTLEQASLKIKKIELANKQIVNRIFNDRLERICETANSILQEIKSDPGELRRTRKFLNVYLDGASKVVEGYAKTQKKSQNSELEQNFLEVLETIESVFKEQKQKLLEQDVFDLDVQIEVLNTQLKREGIR